MLVNEIVWSILEKRNIPPEKRESFLNPRFESCYESNSQLKGLPEAVQRMKKAVQEKEVVAIFGDYDADGIPATALLSRALCGLGINSKNYIPNRSGGYGLCDEVLQKIVNDKINLLITVDNGIVSGKEIAFLKECGIDVIVIDHHIPQKDSFPDCAVAVVDPKQDNCAYPFKDLCGCALAFKVMWALYEEMAQSTNQLKWLLDLVAVSTVADMVPLIDENRAFVVYGLKTLNNTRNKGLAKLIQSAGLVAGQIVSDDLGYKIGPRLNAPSRMHQDLLGENNASLQLLLSEDDHEIINLVRHLNKQNSDRQELLNKHLREAMETLDLNKSCLVVYSPSWSVGIIGLLAGRLMEKYSKPVIALALELGKVRGSVRSCNNVNAVEMLENMSDFLEQFGGHSKAAGLTLQSVEDVEKFKKEVEAWVDIKMSSAVQSEGVVAQEEDCILDISEVDLDLIEFIDVLQPFGVAFPRPVFKTFSSLEMVKKVGKDGGHFSLVLRDGKGKDWKAVWFNPAPGLITVESKMGKVVGIFYQLSINVWQGEKYPSIQVLGLDLQ